MKVLLQNARPQIRLVCHCSPDVLLLRHVFCPASSRQYVLFNFAIKLSVRNWRLSRFLQVLLADCAETRDATDSVPINNAGVFFVVYFTALPISQIR
jgi:hypothetical protein